MYGLGTVPVWPNKAPCATCAIVAAPVRGFPPPPPRRLPKLRPPAAGLGTGAGAGAAMGIGAGAGMTSGGAGAATAGAGTPLTVVVDVPGVKLMLVLTVPGVMLTLVVEVPGATFCVESPPWACGVPESCWARRLRATSPFVAETASTAARQKARVLMDIMAAGGRGGGGGCWWKANCKVSMAEVVSRRRRRRRRGELQRKRELHPPPDLSVVAQMTTSVDGQSGKSPRARLVMWCGLCGVSRLGARTQLGGWAVTSTC